jgi:tetratricopeptide (TPR) repeat protein
MYGLVALTLTAAPFVARRFTDDTPAVATTAVVPELHPIAAVPRYTPSVEAHEWYLRGMDLSLMRTTAGTQRALEYFERAIAADSNFAAAYAGLVRVHLGNADDARGDQNESYARAEQAALRAVALEPSLAEAHGALGWVRVGRLEWTAAEAEFRRAIALDPRAPRVYEGLARAYLWAGRPAEQLQAARVGLEIDPFSHTAIREMALALAANGRCDEALQRLQPLKRLSPPAGVAGVIRGQCFAVKRMWPEAIAEFQWAAETTDARAALAFLGYALARSGRRDEARSILSDLLSGRRYSHGAFGIATVYAGLGDRERAFDWLDRAVGEGTVRPYIMGPMFEDLRGDARFARFKARMGS